MATYHVFSPTADEPEHLAAGLQFLSEGVYEYERQHPPLSRVAVALGPYLGGLESLGHEGMGAEGMALIHASADPRATLAIARLGNLPFFWILALATWLWARRCHGRVAAVLAVLLLATVPPVLGNAGLATTDMSVTALVALALFFLVEWLRTPGIATAAAFGVSAGLALGSKFTAAPFILSAAVALIAVRWLLERPAWSPRLLLARRPLASMAIGTACLFLALWGCYGFKFEAVRQPDARPHERIDQLVGAEGRLHDLTYALLESPAMPLFVGGLTDGFSAVAWHAAEGHESFLLGDTRSHGWWYFYPVAILVKTPVPFLLLSAAGAAWLLRRAWRARSFGPAAPVVACLAILGFAAASPINIGIRHVLVVFPLLAVAAAAWMVAPHGRWSPAARILAAALAIWQVVDAARTHPDHMAYFNVLAGDEPERILLDGDLDWGQDVRRLEAEVRRRGIERIYASLAGWPDLSPRALPGWRPVPREPVTGWVAISLRIRELSGGDYAWLRAHTPVERVGRSIDLYHIEQAPGE